MKIAPSLLQTIGLALLIPCAASFNEAHGQSVKQKVKTEKDSARVKAPEKCSLKPVKAKTGKLKPIPKEDPKVCVACGRG